MEAGYTDQMLFFFFNKKVKLKDLDKRIIVKGSMSRDASTRIGKIIEYPEKQNSLDSIGPGSKDFYADLKEGGGVI